MARVIKGEGGRGEGKGREKWGYEAGKSYFFLEFAEFLVFLFSVFVDFLLGFAASVFHALGSVYGISPWVNFCGCSLREIRNK